ncbi:MAG TPA: helix-turn-helix domain-containing protein [Firmicutes bacterium]|nr:helix-turn-helix domain-containing protein [Bacillota bacterium]
MASSKRLRDPDIEKLFEAVLCLETIEDCYKFFEDICTVAEVKSLAQRLTVARMLDEGYTYTEIAEKTGASTATISRVKRFLLYGADGYKLVFERLRRRGLIGEGQNKETGA